MTLRTELKALYETRQELKSAINSARSKGHWRKANELSMQFINASERINAIRRILKEEGKI